VLAITEHLANLYLGRKDTPLKTAVTPEVVTALRKEMRNRILSQELSKSNVSLFSLKKKK
jgi:hypothetical protein